MKSIAAAFASFLTVLPLAPYELEHIGALIPPSWKAPIAGAGAIATLLLRVNGHIPPRK